MATATPTPRGYLSLRLANLSLTQHGGLAAMTAFALVCSAAVLLPVPAPALRRVRPSAMLPRTSPVMVEGLVDRPIRYAVLVDAENTQHSRMELVMEELAKYGTTSIRFVYGDFTKQSLRAWRSIALDLSFRSVNAFSFTSGKGSSDAAMIIDAMDILHTNEAVDGFVLVSSDSDFTGLAQRLRQAGKNVLGVGKQGTPKPFVTACDRFIYVENLGDTPEGQVQRTQSKRPLDAETLRLLREVIADCSDDDGWAELSEVGAMLSQRKADFDTRSFGFKKLSKLLISGKQKELFVVQAIRDSKKVRHKGGVE